MRLVQVPRLGRAVSATGFGCASLGSRISPSQGHRAIARALDRGVTWFDVAPPYGDGEAEALLGQILHGRRDDVVICTKVGIAPPNIPLAARLVRPLARRAVAARPALRKAIGKARPIGQHVRIDPGAIEAGVTRSLRRLRTDYIDVLALHEPTCRDAANPAIFEVLGGLLKKGIVRAIGVAGEPDSIAATTRAGHSIDIAQFPDSPLANAAPELRQNLLPAPTFVTHGVFASAAADVVAPLFAGRRGAVTALAERHGLGEPQCYADLLLQFAFANNPAGIVVTSMFDQEHIERNVSLASRPPAPEFAEALRAALRDAAGRSAMSHIITA